MTEIPQTSILPKILETMDSRKVDMKTLPSNTRCSDKTTQRRLMLTTRSVLPAGFTTDLPTQPLWRPFVTFFLVTDYRRPKKNHQKTKRNDDLVTHGTYKKLVFSRGLRFFHLALPLFRTCIDLSLGVQGKLREALERQFSSWWFFTNPFEKNILYSQIWIIFFRDRGEPVNKCFKTPPRYNMI